MATSLSFRATAAENFESQLVANIKHFKLYENKHNQQQALARLPLEDLTAIAQAKYESSCEYISTAGSGARKEDIVRDMLLMEIMDWFKSEFFTWMNSPSCPRCQQPTHGIGSGIPTPLEMSKSAGRVEIYTCRACFSDNREVARFPRYNDPVTLLDTRTGRCGEWANCFALICRSAGFETRHVHDHTDHVWVEVFSSSFVPNRWVHVDPCENAYDKPLIYEVGWGKKLTYIVAVSHDDIQDVTPRYSKNLGEVLLRRNQVEESWLVSTIIRLRKGLQSRLPESRQKELQNRLVQEIAEFFMSNDKRDIKETEKVGRVSGSLAWRLARQELGNKMSSCTTSSDGYIWEIGEESIVDNKFELCYNCEFDTYARKGRNGEFYLKGWSNGVFAFDEIFRKEEHDWKMAYLAPQESSKPKTSRLSWKFRVGPGFSVDGLNLNIKYSIFQSDAKFSVKIVTDEFGVKTLLETNVGDNVYTWNSKSSEDHAFLGNLEKCRNVTIMCELTSGSGNDGWQKVQLFRQQVAGSGKPLTMLNKNIFNIEYNIKKIN